MSIEMFHKQPEVDGIKVCGRECRDFGEGACAFLPGNPRPTKEGSPCWPAVREEVMEHRNFRALHVDGSRRHATIDTENARLRVALDRNIIANRRLRQLLAECVDALEAAGHDKDLAWQGRKALEES